MFLSACRTFDTHPSSKVTFLPVLRSDDFRTLLNGLSISSLATYASESDEKTETLVLETLNICRKEIESSKRTLLDEKETPVLLAAKSVDGFDVFLPSEWMKFRFGRKFQQQLHALNVCLSKMNVSFPIHLLASVCKVHSWNLTTQNTLRQEIQKIIDTGIRRSMTSTTTWSVFQDLLWLLDDLASTHLVDEEKRQNAVCIISNALFAWHASNQTETVSFSFANPFEMLPSPLNEISIRKTDTFYQVKRKASHS